MGLALIGGVAALGELDYQALSLEGFGKPDNYLQRQVKRWTSQLESYSQYPNWQGIKELPNVERVARWLEANRPDNCVPGIIHGDYHLANVMYQNDSPELAAIVDWELATIGDPLLDLAWNMATWPDPADKYAWEAPVQPWDGFPSGSELVAHYQQHSTRDLSAFDWYRVLANFKLGILLEGTYARATNGEAPKKIGDDLHRKAVRLFERTANWVN
jgi:aminoglycoside phosphotransferase (APT) family kinase protein